MLSLNCIISTDRGSSFDVITRNARIIMLIKRMRMQSVPGPNFSGVNSAKNRDWVRGYTCMHAWCSIIIFMAQIIVHPWILYT